MKVTIEGACNLGDDLTCPHCGGWKDVEDDICENCEEDMLTEEGDEVNDAEDEEDRARGRSISGW